MQLMEGQADLKEVEEGLARFVSCFEEFIEPEGLQRISQCYGDIALLAEKTRLLYAVSKGRFIKDEVML